MNYYTTEQAARRLGIGVMTLHQYIAAKKVPAPEPTRIGKRSIRAWTDEDIERVREILPKIANGRKTRYQKKQSAVSDQQSAKTRKRKTTKE